MEDGERAPVELPGRAAGRLHALGGVPAQLGVLEFGAELWEPARELLRAREGGQREYLGGDGCVTEGVDTYLSFKRPGKDLTLSSNVYRVMCEHQCLLLKLAHHDQSSVFPDS